MSTKAIVGVVPVKRPISQELLGYRVVAVVPNKAKWHYYKKRYVTSFAAKWRIADTGDFSVKPRLPEILKFIKYLKEWHKISEIEFEGFDK